MALSISVTWCVMLTEILISTEGAPKLGHGMYDPLSFEAAEFKDIDEDFLSIDNLTLSLEDKSTLTMNTEITLFLLNNNSLNKYATKTPTKQKIMTDEFEIIPNKTSSAKPKNITIIKTDIWKLNFKPIKQKAYETTNYEKSFTKSKIYNILRRDNKCNNIASCEASGYSFDPTNCITVDDRILCGYDKNLGTPNNNDVTNVNIENMGNNCILRKDRVECDYEKSPFTSTIRPVLLRTPSRSKSQYRNKRGKHQTSGKKINLDISAITKTTFETITTQRASSETTPADSQRNNNDTFTTSSVIAYTPSSAPSSTTTNVTSPSPSTEINLTALRRNDHESSTNTSNDTYISSTTTSSRFNTESNETEKLTESIETMKCVEKDNRIVCYDLE